MFARLRKPREAQQVVMSDSEALGQQVAGQKIWNLGFAPTVSRQEHDSQGCRLGPNVSQMCHRLEMGWLMCRFEAGVGAESELQSASNYQYSS